MTMLICSLQLSCMPIKKRANNAPPQNSIQIRTKDKEYLGCQFLGEIILPDPYFVVMVFAKPIQSTKSGSM